MPTTFIGTENADDSGDNYTCENLYGLGGNDTLKSGHAGKAYLYGGDGDDLLIYLHQTNGYAVLSGDAGDDTILGGGYGDVLYGGEDDDYLIGMEGSDTIDGGRGTDTIYGNQDNDTLYGGDGADRIDGGNQDDVLYGGDGNDTIATTIIVGNDHDQTTAGLFGGDGNDYVDGGRGNDFLDGGLGNDTLVGGEGDDVMVVDNAADKVIESAGGGNDTVMAHDSYKLGAGQSIETLRSLSTLATNPVALTGNEFGQTIIGNAGADVLDGGLGKDTLQGGDGDDAFFFHSALGATNVDRIVDFAIGHDTIRVDNAFFKALPNGALAESAFKDLTLGSEDADDRILYNPNKGALYYDADGNGAAKAIAFAVLDTHPALTFHDVFVA